MMHVTKSGVLINDAVTVIGEFVNHNGKILLKFKPNALLTRDDVEELPGLFTALEMATGLSSKEEKP